MSAYAHQMEREYSVQSLSSRGGASGTEMGSRYAVESGFYMTSFTATIFIASLVTVGVLLTTLLIALTVMLQSCESKSAGIVEIHKLSDDYHTCRNYALYSELNSFGADAFPLVCLVLAVQYIKGGQYARDLNFTMLMADSYFGSILPSDDRLDVVMMDLDDIMNSEPHYNHLLMNRFDQSGCSDCIEEAEHLKHVFILKLYMKLQASGWPLVLFSRKPEQQRNTTIKNLISAGYNGWSSLIMRLDSEMQMDSTKYFSARREMIQKEGFRITGVISSRMEALIGSCLGKRVFKLPTPIYYNFGHDNDGTNTRN